MIEFLVGFIVALYLYDKKIFTSEGYYYAVFEISNKNKIEIWSEHMEFQNNPKEWLDLQRAILIEKYPNTEIVLLKFKKIYD